MSTPTWTLQDRIRKAREHAGLKQEELAVQLSVTRHTLGRWEKGDNQPPAKKLEALAEATGVPVEWFYAQDNEHPSPSTSQRFTIEVTADGARIINS
ncbi:helix-turn-helix domain-containing protein [Rothia terrae]|uniref:helix-turn-helix domain-containing protein n=1 Tax=Rothia terrae TaxID=396015 RepID=UPI0037F9B79E